MSGAAAAAASDDDGEESLLSPSHAAPGGSFPRGSRGPTPGSRGPSGARKSASRGSRGQGVASRARAVVSATRRASQLLESPQEDRNGADDAEATENTAAPPLEAGNDGDGAAEGAAPQEKEGGEAEAEEGEEDGGDTFRAGADSAGDDELGAVAGDAGGAAAMARPAAAPGAVPASASRPTPSPPSPTRKGPGKPRAAGKSPRSGGAAVLQPTRPRAPGTAGATSGPRRPPPRAGARMATAPSASRLVPLVMAAAVGADGDYGLTPQDGDGGDDEDDGMDGITNWGSSHGDAAMARELATSRQQRSPRRGVALRAEFPLAVSAFVEVPLIDSSRLNERVFAEAIEAGATEAAATAAALADPSRDFDDDVAFGHRFPLAIHAVPASQQVRGGGAAHCDETAPTAPAPALLNRRPTPLPRRRASSTSTTASSPRRRRPSRGRGAPPCAVPFFT